MEKNYEKLTRMEREIRTQQDFIDNAPVGIYRTNLKGEILYVNRNAAKIFEFDSPQEMMAFNVKTFYKNPNDRKRLIEEIDKKGQVVNFEIAAFTSRKETKHLLLSASREGDILKGMIIDITERKKIEEKLVTSQTRFRNLARHLQSTREGERTRIAREIHDELGQSLLALKMDLSLMLKEVPKGLKTLRKKIAAMSELVKNSIKEVKRIATELRPAIIDELGLAAAVEWQVNRFQARTGIKCTTSIEPKEPKVTRHQSTAIFRILQEGLTNIARHSNANRVRVSLKKKGNRVELEIKDNGKGISEEKLSNPSSFGLSGMEERVLAMNGKIKITGKPEKGTTVKVSIPLANNKTSQ
ncbi:MAG: histidine kinase [Candidatus Aminicenantales bacterium]